mmetsp:Transcript_30430/g.46687  ORF Transcript_30430/g.46687 Transcript_30430/m.46687 type:complete len:94 (-) Transcript_30430:148-429(-)
MTSSHTEIPLSRVTRTLFCVLWTGTSMSLSRLCALIALATLTGTIDPPSMLHSSQQSQPPPCGIPKANVIESRKGSVIMDLLPVCSADQTRLL